MNQTTKAPFDELIQQVATKMDAMEPYDETPRTYRATHRTHGLRGTVIVQDSGATWWCADHGYYAPLHIEDPAEELIPDPVAAAAAELYLETAEPEAPAADSLPIREALVRASEQYRRLAAYHGHTGDQGSREDCLQHADSIDLAVKFLTAPQ